MGVTGLRPTKEDCMIDVDAIRDHTCLYLGGLLDEEVYLEDSLVDNLGLDSLDAADIGLKMEAEFRIHIPDEVMNKWVTVQDVVNTVIKLLEEV